MFRWILLIVGVLALSAAVPVVLELLPKDARGRPVMVPTDPEGPTGEVEVDGDLTTEIGVRSQWTKGQESYTVRNVGKGELELFKGTSTCMCTVANFEKDPRTGKERPSIVLAPGESTKISVDWNTKEQDGHFERETSFRSTDPNRPEVTFRVVGEVFPPLIVEPSTGSYDFGSEVANTASQVAPMRIASADKPDFKILSIVSSNPESVDATVRPLRDDEKPSGGDGSIGGYYVSIEVKPSKTIGNFSETLRITTDHPKRSEVLATVYGRRVGPIHVSEGTVRISDATSASGGSRVLTMTVTGQDRTHFEVDQAPEGLDVTVEPVDSASKARAYRLKIAVRPGTEAGVIQGSLVISTDHPEVSSLTIPVVVVVQ